MPRKSRNEEPLPMCVKRVRKAFESRGAANMPFTYAVITAIWAIGDPKELKMPGRAETLRRCKRGDLHKILQKSLPSWMESSADTIDTFVHEALNEGHVSIPKQIPEHPDREEIALRPSGIMLAREMAGV